MVSPDGIYPKKVHDFFPTVGDFLRTGHHLLFLALLVSFRHRSDTISIILAAMRLRRNNMLLRFRDVDLGEFLAEARERHVSAWIGPMNENGLRGRDLKGRSERGKIRDAIINVLQPCIQSCRTGRFVEVRSYRYASPLGGFGSD